MHEPTPLPEAIIRHIPELVRKRMPKATKEELEEATETMLRMLRIQWRIAERITREKEEAALRESSNPPMSLPEM